MTDPWIGSADTQRSISLGEVMPRPKRKRRRGAVLGAVAAAVVVAVGIGLIFASGANRHPTSTPPSVQDSAGKEACGIAKLVNIGEVDRVSVNAIHDDTIHSTRPDLVDRGNQLFDAYNSLAIQEATGQLTAAEVQLRLGAPLLQFQTACIQAGYGQ